MQHHGSNYFDHRPPMTLQMCSVGQNTTFSEHGHVAYQINENHECSNMVANILPADPLPAVHHPPRPPPPPPSLGMGPIGQNATISEHGHVAYQINGIMKCSSMVANILPADPTHPHPFDPGVGVKRSKLSFSEHGHVAYQIKEDHECSNMVANILPADLPFPHPHPHPHPGDGVNRSQFNLVRTWSRCIISN